MSNPISAEEAAEALRQVESSRAAFRGAIRAARGYQHLWLWGAVWAVQCLCFGRALPRPDLCADFAAVVGIAGSMAIGIRQGRRIRVAPDRRFFGALAAVILFGVIWPILLLGEHRSQEMLYAYIALVAMQAYVVTGIWFDTHLLGVGIIVTIFILVGYFWFLPIFWWWMAIFGGGTLIASGFYVRQKWA